MNESVGLFVFWTKCLKVKTIVCKPERKEDEEREEEKKEQEQAVEQALCTYELAAYTN